MKPLVIIPTYNERANVTHLIASVLGVDPSIDVLVVDDSSPDGTGELADDLAMGNRRVKVLHRQGKLGLGTAYITGFKYALARDYDRVVEMDADFSHRPEDLPQLLATSENADVVIGSRSVAGGRTENWSWLRRSISKGGSLYARYMLRLPILDCTSGFKCFRREVLQALDLDAVNSNGFGFQVEMNHLCNAAGFRFAEVPIVFPDRIAGESKMSYKIFGEAATLVWRLRFNRSAKRSRTPEIGGPPVPTGSAKRRLLGDREVISK
ncbi:MAG: undecaprenyl-phosphate mannosyltransferase [Chloroflexi bacterium]|nr:undecaprenyl-phosphate mannosyltransferase [Chloroflexota bacterium]